MSGNKVVTVFSVLLVFILFVAIKPGDNPVLLMRIASISAVIIFIGMIVYTRFLWRMIPFINLHKVIDIGGKWQGKMIFENGEIFDIQANIVQYLDDIKIKVKTNEFFNESLACKRLKAYAELALRLGLQIVFTKLINTHADGLLVLFSKFPADRDLA